MNKKKVVDRSNLPAKMPFYQTIVIFLLIDNYDLHIAFSSCLIVFAFLMWIVFGLSIVTGTEVNIFEDEK